jgi:hypothetical protein
MATIKDVIKTRYQVWVWSLEDGGHWARGPWYSVEQVARDQVAFYESIGRAATYEVEFSK